MKLFNKIAIVCLCTLSLSLFLVSCKREMDVKIVSTTPPSLKVIAKNASGNLYPGVTIKLYADEATWTSEGAPVASKQTGADGSVEFSKDELQNPGYFYIIATEGSYKVKAKTPYLILNDGKTYFNVVVK